MGEKLWNLFIITICIIGFVFIYNQNTDKEIKILQANQALIGDYLGQAKQADMMEDGHYTVYKIVDSSYNAVILRDDTIPTGPIDRFVWHFPEEMMQEGVTIDRRNGKWI